MLQKTFHIIEYTEEKAARILKEVAEMPAYRDAGQVLLLMLEQSWDAAGIRKKTAFVREALPKAVIAGATHFDGLGYKDMTENTLFTFLFFDNPAFRVYRLNLAGREEAAVGRELNGILLTHRRLRGVLTLMSKLRRDTGAMLDAAAEGLSDVPFFGADAAANAFFNGKNGMGWVFDGEECRQDVMLAVAFFGEALSIRVSCNFGWFPVGRTMTVTGVENGYTVTEIDGKPAAQVFERYLGLPYKTGAFAPQAMLMVICMNRMIFLKDRERMETDAYRAVAPQAAFLHGNSEIYRGSSGGEMHSALVAVGFREGPADGAARPRPAARAFPVGNEIIPLENRVLTFMRAVTSDLEKATAALLRLEKNLENEVEIKTRENESLSLHVVQTLAAAIDAKDNYTHGHSGRVAAYTREIARRAGYSERAQNEIFMMGLLHDVGKIGVPDAIINKHGRLGDDEFSQIKKHPEMGGRILDAIREMPKLSTGARWHHERYDGSGYPDGLAGTDIPEEARIIAVADAYDAMTSNRSYRGSMEQGRVRAQIEMGKGAQFDPRFADIMLQMIDEDRDFLMREGQKRGGVYGTV
ncbi:MAG: HD domain-containing protein [Oscillospiraceae bacterium]|nr:HD domain-containing protein [Oscillospiraceae bacterium]